MPDPDDPRCTYGLQHTFVLTAWATRGELYHYATEMLCPTCGTVVDRDAEPDGWRWNPPDDQG